MAKNFEVSTQKLLFQIFFTKYVIDLNKILFKFMFLFNKSEICICIMHFQYNNIQLPLFIVIEICSSCYNLKNCNSAEAKSVV